MSLVDRIADEIMTGVRGRHATPYAGAGAVDVDFLDGIVRERVAGALEARGEMAVCTEVVHVSAGGESLRFACVLPSDHGGDHESRLRWGWEDEPPHEASPSWGPVS